MAGMGRKMRCAQCKAELPPEAHKEWGYTWGSLKFCSYGCMRTKSEDILAKQKEKREKKKEEAMEKLTEQLPEEEKAAEQKVTEAPRAPITTLPEDPEARAVAETRNALFPVLPKENNDGIHVEPLPPEDRQVPGVALKEGAAVPVQMADTDLRMIQLTRSQCRLVADMAQDELERVIEYGVDEEKRSMGAGIDWLRDMLAVADAARKATMR